MNVEEYKPGIISLDSKDNKDWIEKVTCLKKEFKYNIYIFLVIVEDELELEKIYDTIAASIATEFQINLSRKIEKWNIYLIFESRNIISENLKFKIEQDKYSSRKIVWDLLGEKEIGNKEFLDDRLFNLSINKDLKKVDEKKSLLDTIKKCDIDLYKTLELKSDDIQEQVDFYLGSN